MKLKENTGFGIRLKKLASLSLMANGDDDCDDVYPTWAGPDLGGIGEDCEVSATVNTIYDANTGCAVSQNIVYNGHECPGDDSADESGYGSGNESGSGSGGELSEPPYGGGGNTVGFSCKSFAFRNITSNWKEAGVKNIRFKVLSGVHPVVYSKMVVMPTLIFGIPRTIPAGDAETFCATMVQLAMNEVYLLYRSYTVLPTDHAIIEAFKHHLAMKMTIYGGRAAIHGPHTDPRVVIKEANYDILGNGDCND